MKSHFYLKSIVFVIFVFITQNSQGALNDKSLDKGLLVPVNVDIIQSSIDTIRQYSGLFNASTNCLPPHQCTPTKTDFQHSPVETKSINFDPRDFIDSWVDLLDFNNINLNFYVSPNKNNNEDLLVNPPLQGANTANDVGQQ